jgi:hypothetical protein
VTAAIDDAACERIMRIAVHRQVWTWVGIFAAVVGIATGFVVLTPDPQRESKVLVGTAPIPTTVAVRPVSAQSGIEAPSKAAATHWRKKLATIDGGGDETRYATILGGHFGGEIGNVAGTLGKLLPFDDKPGAPIASAAPPSPLPPPPATAASAPPAAPVAAGAAADEAACREKMRHLGVVSAGPCIDVSGIVENLARGKYLFNKPKTAYVGEAFRVMLVLQTAPGQDARALFPATAGEVTEREGKFAQSLEATLGGDDVKVEPSGPQARTATMAEAVQWEWTLTPQSGGQKTMVIEVAATIFAGPDKHRVQVTTLREPIVIQVGVVQRIKLYLAEANGVAAAAVALFTTLGGLFGFVPPVRRFVLKYVGHADRNEVPNTPA